MGARFEEGKRVISQKACSKLLEFAATDDLAAFIQESDRMGSSDTDHLSHWYGRSFGPTPKMCFQERTPIMIAALCGSTSVLKHILSSRKVDVNRAAGSDGATALHCAAAAGSCLSVELLIDASADTDAVDVAGRKPGDLISKFPNGSKRKAALETLLLAGTTIGGASSDEGGSKTPRYPADLSLPDINNGLYGTDEFRMYSFKVKPCSRAYSHDWTECPFVHPGENARRRDPRKFHYTCVPCPDFKKGSCSRADSCEYAHGVFESWLHPAQYRTRLCKDETGCPRKVCFFAHRPEDLRPLYPSTGSGLPSPKSNSPSNSSLSPLSLSPSLTCSSPTWQSNLTPPPALQLPGSRLKTSFSARNMDLQRKQLIDEMVSSLSSSSSPYGRMGDLKPTNLDDVFGSQTRQQVRASYPSNGFDSSAAVAVAVMNARSSALANKQRSQSFNYRAGLSAGPTASSPKFSPRPQWGSPDGKLEWGFSGEDESKLRKSASFGNRNEPDVSWVNSLVKDGPVGGGEMMPYWFDQVCIEQEQMVA